ncbi:TPA: RNA-protein complex protein Nop10 [Candidatus Woesearchaeota archaeon]|nr:RNA-protein complex protein Nop10 [Candidatus Woesearchaeota archaeon]
MAKNQILKCTSCGKYTMKELCGCGSKAVSPKPPKYSPEDKYGDYRRKVKHDDLVSKGLL